ncbi:hypothetical protein AOQ84DRAFT_363862 [Glonium stellatum]|uniref:Uncharacterized protein n=1 Tax=Glonium stellatum TaxID=574774 RepID=A0A8E2F1T0_9PEZI|nr:hypothetical protein AOQ84DRAFT_363862 [Glonium stellatum]
MRQPTLTGLQGHWKAAYRDPQPTISYPIFDQSNVPGDGHYLFRAFAHAHWGDQIYWPRVQYDVQVLCNYRTRGWANNYTNNNSQNDYSAGSAVANVRLEEFFSLACGQPGNDLTGQVFGNLYGIDEMLQFLADAYDVQIFAHTPVYDIETEVVN